MTPQPTRPATVTIEHARQVMAAVLAADLPLPDRLAVGEALSVLSDVHPPYPPLPEPGHPEPDVAAAVTDVLALLDLALRQSTSTEEVIRVGTTARVLREHATRRTAPSQPPATGRPAGDPGRSSRAPWPRAVERW
jgi:hypothetical protein